MGQSGLHFSLIFSVFPSWYVGLILRLASYMVPTLHRKKERCFRSVNNSPEIHYWLRPRPISDLITVVSTVNVLFGPVYVICSCSEVGYLRVTMDLQCKWGLLEKIKWGMDIGVQPLGDLHSA